MDRAIAANLQEARRVLTPQSFSLVEADQRAFDANLDARCAGYGKYAGQDDPQCLAAALDNRNRDLRLYDIGGGGTLFKVGSGENRGLRVDRPTPQQQQWMTAFQQRMEAVNRRGAKDLADAKKEAGTDSPVQEYSVLVKPYIDTANARMICVHFQLEENLGGPHGNTNIEHWNYWLDTGRDLTAADVFLPNSEWKKALTRQILRVLQSSPDKSKLWGDGLEQGVAKGLEPTRWALTNTLLYVTFQEYDIAAYSAGSSTVSIDWNRLRPMLQPGLHPETLPPDTAAN